MYSLERRALELFGIRTALHKMPLRLRVAASQLPLVLSVILALPIVAAVSPVTFTRDAFQLGLLLLAVASAASVIVPWGRLSGWSVPAYWVIPLLDFAAIGCLYTGGRSSVTGLSLLCLFPVFWLAWSGAAHRLGAVLSLLGTLAVVWSPAISTGANSVAELAGPLLIPVIMLAIFSTVAIVQGDTTAQHERLAATEAELQGSLEETSLRSQLLDAVLETVDVGVVAMDAAGRTVLMNSRQRANHALAGLDGRPESSENALIFDVDQVTRIPVGQRPSERATREESFSDVIVWVGAGERQRALTVCARALRTNGAFAGSVVAYSDVTDMVNALNAREDFVSSVSHELRTPLTSIIGYLDLVLDDLDPDSVPAHMSTSLQVAQRNAERLLLLVADLLTTASGTMHLHKEETDMAALVQASVDAAAVRAGAAGVSLTFDCEPEVKALVDPDRMSQVLDNLLSNAIKYSPDGGKVCVRARAEGSSLVIEVEDNGIGMSEADQREVFTKFFRTGQVKKAAIPGVGLGLVITKSIVEAHGGKIDFNSTLGSGTTFRLGLRLSSP
ncbi:PAS domain-containing sensor histidine kinase [Arthrobacter sp. zg-ZUI100]|uniref:sensor histidine kinase n=1 Tax=Arthrobacter jiangjiafuii TaxID=2817475 RepID=UPI001AEE2BCE|nr:ATP-binding protein [Arthrobacter jiangjiafuii]MBP3037154.1 PAS domain-containing sensor histidine kinase [Arthrobacter jiangjiafuii]